MADTAMNQAELTLLDGLQRAAEFAGMDFESGPKYTDESSLGGAKAGQFLRG